MARDATARLYDVERNSVVLKKQSQSQRYDIGAIHFRAKEGRTIDLDKLHESVWATRLSGGTRSGLVRLEVTAVGDVSVNGSEGLLKVAGSDATFVLASNPEQAISFDRLRQAVEGKKERVVSVTGRLDGWSGLWPEVLRQLPPKPRRLLVIGFETAPKP